MICNTCNIEKDISNFYVRKDSKTGYRNNCIQCHSIRHKIDYCKCGNEKSFRATQCSSCVLSYHDNIENQVVSMRLSGMLQKDIAVALNISRGSVNNYISRKIKKEPELFNQLRTNRTYYRNDSYMSKLRAKIGAFCNDPGHNFTCEELLNKYGGSPACALTNRPIDLSDSSSYHLDHIIPKSKGGNDSLENCQLACSAANYAKHSLTLDEFYSLCLEVVSHLKTS